MKHFLYLLLLSLCTASLTQCADLISEPPPILVRGTVIDRLSSNAMVGVLISFEDSSLNTRSFSTTNGEGAYRIMVGIGLVEEGTLRFESDGYAIEELMFPADAVQDSVTLTLYHLDVSLNPLSAP